MVKQPPSKGLRGPLPGMGSGETGDHTTVDWLNHHAEEFEPPMGNLHMHLIFAQTLHWRIVTKGSFVCHVPGRCHLVRIRMSGMDLKGKAVAR